MNHRTTNREKFQLLKFNICDSYGAPIPKLGIYIGSHGSVSPSVSKHFPFVYVSDAFSLGIAFNLL